MTPRRTPASAASRAVEDLNSREQSLPPTTMVDHPAYGGDGVSLHDSLPHPQVAGESDVRSETGRHPASQDSQKRSLTWAAVVAQSPRPSINGGGVQNLIRRSSTNAGSVSSKHAEASRSEKTLLDSAVRAPLPPPPPPSDTQERRVPGTAFPNQPPIDCDQPFTSLDQIPESLLRRLPLSERCRIEETFKRRRGRVWIRPLTNAEQLSRQHSEASSAGEIPSSSTAPALLTPPDPASGGPPWPSLSESNSMGEKGKSKRGPKPESKNETKPGPKPGPGPSSGYDSDPDAGPNFTPVHVVQISYNGVDWSTILNSFQLKTKSIFDFPFERGQNANPKTNSYFASNGSAPLAKEKDSLAKLFEKYRG